MATNYPLSPIVAPSYVSIEDPVIQNVWVGTNVVVNESIFNAFLDLHIGVVPPSIVECAEGTISFVNNKISSDVIGPCSQNDADENTLSGLFAGLLQHLFSTHLSSGAEPDFTPEVLVSTQRKMAKGNNDITMYKVVDSGLHPRVVWEFSVNRKAKEGQLFAYVNNMDGFISDDYQIMAIGVIVVMERNRPPELQVNGFVKMVSSTATHPLSAAIPKPMLGMCLLYRGAWNASSLSRLLFCIQNWLRLPMGRFALPAAGALRDRPNASRTVLRRHIAGVEWVYKIFDRRLKRSAQSRYYGPSLQFLPGCELVHQSVEMEVIRYPFISGPHLPQSSVGTVRVLRHLAAIHAEGYVHCDIKASNLIFGESGSVIDFDFCAPVGSAKYPDGFNINIADGVRAPRVVQLMQVPPRRREAEAGDDCFSMSAVLRMVQPVAVDMRPQWDEWCAAVSDGHLDAVATAVAAAENISLQEVSAIPLAVPMFEGGTGSPPAAPASKKRGASGEA